MGFQKGCFPWVQHFSNAVIGYEKSFPKSKYPNIGSIIFASSQHT